MMRPLVLVFGALSLGLSLFTAPLACAAAHGQSAKVSTTSAVVELGENGDVAPLSQDKSGVQYDRRPLGDKRFDGSADDNWLRNPQKLCRAGSLRPIIVDVDKTAVKGNFLNKVQVYKEARRAIVDFDKRYGVIFVSANFAVDRMQKFFSDYAYPADAPLITRPRNYWQADYDSWCRLDQRYALCESANKSAVIENFKQRCARNPQVMVGVGDRFSDYLAYRQAGLCPVIVPDGHVVEVNKRERQAGCVLKDGADDAWLDDGKGKIERCAVVPERYIHSWDWLEKNMDAILSGQLKCGAGEAAADAKRGGHNADHQ